MSRVETIGRATHIYALSDEDGRVRYVGKTVRSLGRRLSQHKVQASRERSHLPVCRWLKKHDVSIGLLETVPPGGDWAGRERHWIERFDNLLNLTNGGEGLTGHRFSQEHKDKIAAALRTGARFNCLRCDASFWRKRSAIDRGKTKFCSRNCANIHNRGGHHG